MMPKRFTVALVAVGLVAVGVAAGAATQRFTDVPEDHWAAEAIEWATENGIMRERGKGLFEPNKPITRAHLATILYRYDQAVEEAGEKYRQRTTIAQDDIFLDIVSTLIDDEMYGTSNEFDNAYSWYGLELLVNDLCETLGDTPANASMRDTRQVIPDWLEATEWKKGVTGDDKWRVVFYGHQAYCPEYESIYDVWADADWPGT